jgi:NADH-quinone oxidoreductase subunit N
MWAPDVYEGAPTPITAFLTVGSKAAGFAAMIRFFYVVMATRVPGLEAVGASWSATVAPAWPILIGMLALVTMTVGNLSALHQTNAKRLLGYSSIAHAGYLMLGFVVLSEEGLRSVLFYLLVYCAMNLGAFLVVGAVADETGSEDVSAFKGLGKRSWLVAASMTIFLFSLVGLPPFAGFAGKLHLFIGVIHRAQQPGEGLAGYSWFFYLLAIAAVVNSVLSLVYYARFIKAMYLEDTADNLRPVQVAPLYVALMGFLVMPTLFLGIMWEGTLTWAQNSIAFFGMN